MSVDLNGNLPILQQQIAAASHVLIGLDYDGTLTPIVGNPVDAVLAPAVRDVLAELAMLPHTTVAIVTGRALADIKARVDLDNLIYAGNHGLEIHGPDLSFLEPSAALLASFLAKTSRELRDCLARFPGVIIDEKGLTLSVHFRLADPSLHNDILCEVYRIVATRESPFRLSLGKMVWEICPRVGWHKGKALDWVRTHRRIERGLTIYLGDDQTDEDAFRFLEDCVSVKVGPAIETYARFHLTDTAQVYPFLVWLSQTRRAL
jgi:trehalose 6-phosphate phosphatase